jgi:lipopolysaccharide exporter
MTGNLRRKTVENIGLTATSKIVALVFQAAANVILSRSLSSTDYGVVGFAWIFINFLFQFNDVGINSAAVQKQELDRSVLSTAFTIQVSLGVGLFCLAFVGAPLAHLFFDNGAVVGVIRLLSLNFVIGALGFVPNTLLQRALDYRKIAIANTCATAVNASVSIVLALLGFGYWSIVVANLAGSVVVTVVLNVIEPHTLRFNVNAAQAHELIRYGRGLFASNFVIFAVFNADIFIIGALAGSTTLGYYTLAFQWGSMVSTLMAAVIHSVLFPTLSRIQDDTRRVRSAYLASLRYVSLFGILTNVTLILTAKDFLYDVLGHGSDKWLPALGALKILAVYGMIRVVLEPLGPVLMAVGRTKLLLMATLTAAAIELATLYPSVKLFGIEGAAVSVTFAYAVQYAVYYPFLRREFGIRTNDILRAVGPAAGAAATLVPVVYIHDYFLTARDGTLLFAYRVFMCMALYLLFYVAITRRNPVEEVRALFGRATHVSP